MKFHVSGEFIAVVEVGFQPNDDEYSVSDTGSALMRRVIQRATMERLNEVLEKVRRGHQVNIAIMPQYIEGMMID